MRLNKNTYPAYGHLEGGENLRIDAMIVDYFDSKSFNFFLKSIFELYNTIQKRYYLTNTFKEAIITALPKINDGEKHLENIPNDCGIIFTDGGFTLYKTNTLDYKILCYGFKRDGLTTFGYVNKENFFGGIGANIKDGKPFNDTKHLAEYLNSVLTTLYFINNCEIETKVLPPKQKHKINGEKHFNESKNDILILDCKWFTDLIRDTPFTVRGHLRWQPHGEKRSKRKLIWIDEFEKSGYSVKAKKTATDVQVL